MTTFFVYMMTNRRRVVFYTGVPNDLAQRVWGHKHGEVKGFTNRYRCDRLVYHDGFSNAGDAIAFEKQVKGWTRAKKNAPVNAFNPGWADLSWSLFDTMRGPSPSARLRMTPGESP